MEEKEKGCVYFFRHIGLSPIKIGYSENESPYKRFEQFKTYAPFGAELIGFIRTNESKKLETELHQKYSRDRIKGEWFEISKEEAEKCILFHSNLLDIEEKNNFEISWAKRIHEKNIRTLDNSDYTDLFLNIFSLEKIDGYEKIIINKLEVSEILKISKQKVRFIFIKLNLTSKAFRVNGVIKKGVLLYKLKQ